MKPDNRRVTLRSLTVVACIAFSMLLLPAIATAQVKAKEPIKLVPYPAEITVTKTNTNNAKFALTADSRIVVADKKLAPLAAVLAQEITQTTSLKLQTAEGKAQKGDIVLKLDPALKGEAYTLAVADEAQVVGGNYVSVAMGTVTLLQALNSDGDGKTIPGTLNVTDSPKMPYRGLMVDVARRYNSIDDLKGCVILCRLYKVPFLHLHLTDDQAWTFPSKAFPKLGEKNKGFRGRAPEVYKLEDLKALVKFADDRGVTIIPELDVPAHTDQLRIPYPQVFDANDGPAHLGMVDMTNAKAYEGLDALVGELCEVFQSSPYIHIGGDEANIGRAKLSPTYEDFMKAKELEDPYDLYCYFLVEMDKIVKKHGKQTMLWGDFRNTGSKHAKIPTDVIAFSWHDDDGNAARNYIKNGYSVINASWNPYYIVNQTVKTVDIVEDARGKRRPETIYGNDVFQFGKNLLPFSDKMIGVQICAWEQGGEIQVASERPRLPAMSERGWNPSACGDFEEFKARLDSTDKLLTKLLPPATRPATDAAQTK